MRLSLTACVFILAAAFAGSAAESETVESLKAKVAQLEKKNAALKSMNDDLEADLKKEHAEVKDVWSKYYELKLSSMNDKLTLNSVIELLNKNEDATVIVQVIRNVLKTQAEKANTTDAKKH